MSTGDRPRPVVLALLATSASHAGTQRRPGFPTHLPGSAIHRSRHGPAPRRRRGPWTLDRWVRLAAAKANRDQCPQPASSVAFRRRELPAPRGLIQDVSGTWWKATRIPSQLPRARNTQVDVGNAIYRSLAVRQARAAADQGLAAPRQDTSRVPPGRTSTCSWRRRSERPRRPFVSRASTSPAPPGGRRRHRPQGRRAAGNSVQARRNRLALQQATEQRRVLASRLAESLRLDPTVTLVARDIELSSLAP